MLAAWLGALTTDAGDAAADKREPVPPLRQNRDFQILWAAQVVSTLGAQASGIALPLLVLALTDSPAKAGITAAAATLPRLVLILHAGVLADRLNRKLMMIACDAVRAFAVGSVAVLYFTGHLPFWVLPVIAFVEGTGSVFFEIAERAAIPQIVHDEQLHAAIAQNQVRNYGAWLVGPPLGGVLFAAGRAVPFLVDAVSYVVSIVALFFIRTPFQQTRATPPGRVRREIVEGVVWLWHQPFLRTTSLLVTGSDMVINALFLTIIVVAREDGASSSEIGVMVAFLGIGGLAGALIAPRLARRLSVRAAVRTTMWLEAILVPFLIVVREPLAMGLILGLMMALHPLWDVSVGGYQLRITPDRLQGRTQSVYRLFALGAIPLALVVVGSLLETIGATATIVAASCAMGVVALAAGASRAVRDVPNVVPAPASSGG
jgi:predicted MFS family arabinose efflux permease